MKKSLSAYELNRRGELLITAQIKPKDVIKSCFAAKNNCSKCNVTEQCLIYKKKNQLPSIWPY